MRKTLAAIAAFLLVGSLSATATASHPTQICLEVEPERASPSGNDDEVDFLTAYIGATDADHPPRQDGCVFEDGATFEGMEVDFEITGAGDFDDSDSPDSPDFGCTVPKDSNNCFIEAPRSNGGDQTIAAWLDFDSDTVALDRDEGPDEAAEPGAAEPDGTDVALWTWRHRDSSIRRLYSQVTIDFSPGSRTFFGRVSSESRRCRTDRKVFLMKRRGGKAVVKASTLARAGRWSLDGLPARRGRFFARVKTYYFTSSNGVAESQCWQDRSPPVRVR